ncbi:hypothetical protein JEQ12_004864 [Ovis aries]|uniref:Uncharacterized protein n=1 Tax=Ovis aries TaxID=9940 RepID=A0A836A0E1_SHEEP|nr:hypothetical protein JEQ12_004864 [Ovis aries]
MRRAEQLGLGEVFPVGSWRQHGTFQKPGPPRAESDIIHVDQSPLAASTLTDVCGQQLQLRKGVIYDPITAEASEGLQDGLLAAVGEQGGENMGR